MYVCMSSSYLSHTPTQSPHWVSFYRFWTTIAITGKKAAQREREWERETLITQTKHLHMHTHSHPLSKLWRNLGLALVFTTKVQWSIAKPKKKLMRECVCEREQTKRAPRLLRMLLGRGRSLALCRAHASHVETSTRRQTEREWERKSEREVEGTTKLWDGRWGRSTLSAAFFLSCNFCACVEEIRHIIVQCTRKYVHVCMCESVCVCV